MDLLCFVCGVFAMPLCASVHICLVVTCCERALVCGLLIVSLSLSHWYFFHDQSPRKYGTGPGSNLRPLNMQSDTILQSDTLPTVLFVLTVLRQYCRSLKREPFY